jgi:hypothetical protein
MSNLMLGGFRTASDYAKAKMTQDQLIKVAIANDANIAKARSDFRKGIVPVPNSMEDADKVEIEMDINKQYDIGITNLKSLGFKDTDAGGLVADLTSDELMMMNSTFPAIKKDVEARFNVRTMTPQFFFQYLEEYLDNLQASKGISGTTYPNDKYNLLIDTSEDLRQILPSREDVNDIIQNVGRLRLTKKQQMSLQPLIQRLQIVEEALPNDEEYDALDSMKNEDSAKAYRMFQDIQKATARIPTREQFQEIKDAIAGGDATAGSRLIDLMSGVNLTDMEALNSIFKALEDEKVEFAKAPQLNYEYETNTDIGYLGIVGSQIYMIDVGNGRVTQLTTANKKQLADSFPPRSDAKRLASRTLTEIRGYVINKVNEEAKQQQSSISTNTSKQTKGRPKKELVIEGDDEELGADAGKVAMSGATTAGGEQDLDAAVVESGSGIKRFKKIKIKVGKGIAVEAQPTYKELGKYAIHWGQLVNNDILNVKYKSLGGIPKFKPVAVSDVFKDFLIDLMETGKVNKRIYDQVPVEERKLFENIASGAGISSALKLQKTKSNQDVEDNKRFEILKGEYLAGNNSPTLIRELRRFIVRYMNEGKITKNSGLQLLMELSV